MILHSFFPHPFTCLVTKMDLLNRSLSLLNPRKQLSLCQQRWFGETTSPGINRCFTIFFPTVNGRQVNNLVFKAKFLLDLIGQFLLDLIRQFLLYLIRQFLLDLIRQFWAIKIDLYNAVNFPWWLIKAINTTWNWFFNTLR